jgi:prevent-host-death family protein
MRSIGSYQLKTHLSEILNAVEHGQTVIVTRHGKPIARIMPNETAEQEQTHQVVEALKKFPRTRLPKGVSIRSLIEAGRR